MTWTVDIRMLGGDALTTSSARLSNARLTCASREEALARAVAAIDKGERNRWRYRISVVGPGGEAVAKGELIKLYDREHGSLPSLYWQAN